MSNMVQGDPDEIDNLARSAEGALSDVREALQRVGGQLRNAESWNDRKHDEICEAFEEAVALVLRSLEPVESELVPRMRRIAGHIREAQNA